MNKVKIFLRVIMLISAVLILFGLFTNKFRFTEVSDSTEKKTADYSIHIVSSDFDETYEVIDESTYLALRGIYYTVYTVKNDGKQYEIRLGTDSGSISIYDSDTKLCFSSSDYTLTRVD